MSRQTSRDAVPKRGGRRAPMTLWLTLALALLASAGAAQAQGADAQGPRQRVLAATCSHCHGTDGRAVEGEAFVRLAGRPADELLAQLMAFRSGQRPATVMHQIAKGYTPEQIDQLAAYFAAQK